MGDEPNRYADPYTKIAWYEVRVEQLEAENERLREALQRIRETAQAWSNRDAELGEDSTEWRLAAESRAGLMLNFARAALAPADEAKP